MELRRDDQSSRVSGHRRQLRRVGRVARVTCGTLDSVRECGRPRGAASERLQDVHASVTASPCVPTRCLSSPTRSGIFFTKISLNGGVMRGRRICPSNLRTSRRVDPLERRRELQVSEGSVMRIRIREESQQGEVVQSACRAIGNSTSTRTRRIGEPLKLNNGHGRAVFGG